MPDASPRLLRRLAVRLGRLSGGRARERREAASAERSARRAAARTAADAGRARDEHDRTVAELRAQLRHAEEQLALYRRRSYLGRGDPRRLAELERVAHGAAERLRRTEAR